MESIVLVIFKIFLGGNIMKKYFLFLLTCTLFFVFSFTSLANDTIEQADALFEKGDVTSILESIPLYIKAVGANQDSYEANWKCARAHREYANLNLEQESEDWEDICKKYGKDGMEYGECVASYSDGVSILKALKEGLKGSTQDAFYAAYEIDKMFAEGGPILSIARFWHQLPFPLRNKKRAERKKDEAKPLLEKAVAGDEPYYSKWAKRLLEDL